VNGAFMRSLSVRRAGKFGPTLTANAFGHHACDDITEIQVLEGAANVVAWLQIAHCRQHLRGRQITGHPNPIMVRQPGMMTEQIAYRNAVGRDGVMQPKFRDVVPHWLFPIKALAVYQEGQTRRGERLRIEPIRNCVSVVTFKPASASRRPWAVTTATSPFCTTVMRGPESSTRPSVPR
jgi:hypothetical protein